MNHDWWKGAVFYQIYPRSFNDANGDGVGDLRGITRKMDYLSDLGVDALWISPFFASPMKDFGYDVSDYCAIDPLFGDMRDFDDMIAAAHARGLRVVIDMVLSHTSDQHAWFTESRSNRDNPKADWYVWADPQADGTPPNNWQAVFGGSSWEFDMRRGQYYLHNFLREQPDLNLHNPAVRAALLECCRFWLRRGVDGFRLDATTFFFHSQGLEDNPPNPNPQPSQFNIDFPVPFSMQLHINDSLIPETTAFIEEFRTMLNEFDDRMAVAEVGGEDGVKIAAQFTDGPKRLHTAYNFSLISGHKTSAAHIRGAIEEFAAAGARSWPSWAFSNHDVVRIASRWGGADHENNPAFARVLLAVLMSLRGTPFIYQGEELGLPDVKIKPEEIQDPWGLYLYPLWQGRDGCRTPMPWKTRARHAWFSKARKTWLPIPADHAEKSVQAQEKDSASALRFTQQFLRWRREQQALIDGEITFLDTQDDHILAFIRKGLYGPEMLCVFNLGAEPVKYKPDVMTELTAHSAFVWPQNETAPQKAGPRQSGDVQNNPQGQDLYLPPFGFYYASLPSSK